MSSLSPHLVLLNISIRCSCKFTSLKPREACGTDWKLPRAAMLRLTCGEDVSTTTKFYKLKILIFGKVVWSCNLEIRLGILENSQVPRACCFHFQLDLTNHRTEDGSIGLCAKARNKELKWELPLTILISLQTFLYLQQSYILINSQVENILKLKMHFVHLSY